MKFLLLLMAIPGALLAQTLEGTWQGMLALPNGREARIVIQLTKNGNTTQGILINIDPGGGRAPISAATLQGTTVKMTIPGMGGTYDGKMEADGNSITGTVTQLPLLLKRATTETAWEIPPPPAPPKTLPANAKLEFEVATIKPSPEGRRGFGINVVGTNFRTTDTKLIHLITFAYGVHPNQLSGLPSWADNELFDILAPMPSEGMPSEPQLRIMLQNLIKDRFALEFHREKRELSVYSIGIGKGGATGMKMTKNESKQPLPGLGFRGLGRMFALNATMADFASLLQMMVLDRPVIDQSGITDRFDFNLNWTPDEFQFPSAGQRPPAPATPDAPPDLFSAFQEQLGMKLEATKAPTDVLVVDKVTRPSEN